MTRARALKEVIRARAARTGERYTAARRHVLNSLQPRPRETPPPARVPLASASASATSTKPKGGLSDVKALEKTGHGLEYWFNVLDRFGAVDKGHTAAARHLYQDHQVPGWYAQGITVAYERTRGVREANQRCDGEYQVSVSKVMGASVEEVVRALTGARERKRWTKGGDASLIDALVTSLDRPASKGVVVRADGLGRYRYKWGGTTVQLYLQPKAGGKVSIVATNSKLSGATMVEERRRLWRQTLDALAGLYSPARKKSA